MNNLEPSDQQSQYIRADDEIDLRECIYMLWKWKHVIVGITVLAMLVSGILSFFVIKPTYEASTSVMVSQVQVPSGSSGSSIEALVRKLTEQPQMTATLLAQQVKAPEVLDRTAERLSGSGHNLSTADLDKMIQAENAIDTDIIKITVSGPDPILVTDIANKVREEFIRYANDSHGLETDKALDTLEKLMEAEETQLLQATEKLVQLQLQSKSVNLLTAEVDGRTEELIALQSALNQKEVEKEALRERIRQHRLNLENTPKTVSKVMHLDGLLGQQEGTISSEEINPAYTESLNSYNADLTSLAGSETEIAITKKLIGQLEAEIKELQADLTEKQTERNRLKNEVSMRQKTIDMLVSKRSEMQILRSTDLAEASISTVSPAFTPQAPVKPRKMLNIALAGVLGLMLSVLGMYFMEYIKKDSRGYL
jgi:succinoglycan biosynthesis transport protein ExoP